MSGGPRDIDFGRTQGSTPPPPPPVGADAQVWHVSAGGKTVGPATAEQVRRSIAAGKVPLSAVVWKDGMADWLTLSHVPEFANVTVRPTPPPPPVDAATTDTRRAQALDASRTMQQPPPGKPDQRAKSLDYGSTMQHGAPPASRTTAPPSQPQPSAPPTVQTGTDFPVGHVLDERLVITLKLGQGGMGAVYRVTDRETHVEYAIKVLTPELVGSPAAFADLRKEVARAQPLTHQNLLNIKYFADSGPVKYIVMENIDGEDLESYRLRKGGRISPADFSKFVPQILAGMEFLHERGVVHLDIKPQNIMVSNSGEVKITDYGISRTIKEQLSQREQSQVSSGTLCFMPPEQIRPGSVCDRRADIYALGMTFHLLLAGRFPFPLDDRQQVIHWHLDERHAIEDLGSPLFNRVVAKSVASRADSRWLSCREMLQELQQSSPNESSSAQTLPTSAASSVGGEQLIVLLALGRKAMSQRPWDIALSNTFAKVVKTATGTYLEIGTGLKASFATLKAMAGEEQVDIPQELAFLIDERRVKGVKVDATVQNEVQDFVARAKTNLAKDKALAFYYGILVVAVLLVPITFAQSGWAGFWAWGAIKRRNFNDRVVALLGK